jgi:PPOX class probable F420-dependent enzyme
MVSTQVTVRRVTVAILALLPIVYFFVLTTCAADEVTKPAQRKRLGGIQPFTKEHQEAFLAERRNVTIASINKDGTPQVTPVVYYWDGAAFYISVTKETVKYQNIKRDPRISLIVDDVLDHHCVIAKGKATIQEDNIWDMTSKIMHKYYGKEEGDAYIEQLKKQNRVLIVLKPKKMQAWGPKPREEGTTATHK